MLTVTDPPDAISSITVGRGKGTLNLSWAVPHGGGSAIMVYEAECRTRTGDAWGAWSSCASNITASGSEGSTFTTTVMNVTDNKEYTVRVRSQNAVYWSSWTQSGTIAKAAPPTQVSGFSATRTSGTITVTWGALANATSYNLRLKESNGTLWLQIKNGLSSNAATLSNVDDSKAYIVSVQPVNAFGSGTWNDSGVISAMSSN